MTDDWNSAEIRATFREVYAGYDAPEFMERRFREPQRWAFCLMASALTFPGFSEARVEEPVKFKWTALEECAKAIRRAARAGGPDAPKTIGGYETRHVVKTRTDGMAPTKVEAEVRLTCRMRLEGAEDVAAFFETFAPRMFLMGGSDLLVTALDSDGRPRWDAVFDFGDCDEIRRKPLARFCRTFVAPKALDELKKRLDNGAWPRLRNFASVKI